jgi:hypothetical protein
LASGCTSPLLMPGLKAWRTRSSKCTQSKQSLPAIQRPHTLNGLQY